MNYRWIKQFADCCAILVPCLLLSGCDFFDPTPGPAVIPNDTPLTLWDSATPTYWNNSEPPQVGQIFRHVVNSDGSSYFESESTKIATDLASAKQVSTVPAVDDDFSLTTTPQISAALTYLGIKAGAGAEDLKEIDINSSQDEYAYVPERSDFTNALKNKAKYTDMTQAVTDDATRRNAAEPPLSDESAKYWVVVRITYSQKFLFDVQSAQGALLEAGTGNSTLPTLPTLTSPTPSTTSSSSTASTSPSTASQGSTSTSTSSATSAKQGTTAPSLTVNVNAPASSATNSPVVNSVVSSLGSTLPSASLSASLTAKNTAQVSYTGNTPLPLFVAIEPLVLNSKGEVVASESTKAPPFSTISAH